VLRKLLLVSVAVCVCASGATPIAQSDLDALMERVLLKRDDNWKKLQQYVLEERETMEVTALDGRRVYGFKREYQWFPRQGFFIKSPLTSDGVKIGEGERRIQEARWLAREQFREKRRAEVAGHDRRRCRRNSGWRTQVHTCGRRQRVAPDRSEPILAAGARGTATREAGARFARVLQRR